MLGTADECGAHPSSHTALPFADSKEFSSRRIPNPGSIS